MNKSVVKYTLPLHIGFFVYQYAKLRMLQFYYDFVDRYVETTAVSVLRDGHRLGIHCNWLVKVSMGTRQSRIVAHTTSDTDHSGFRPNVVTNTKTTMSVLE